jgi:hypothetical protein
MAKSRAGAAHAAVQRGHGAPRTKAVGTKGVGTSTGNKSSYTASGKDYSLTKTPPAQMGRYSK